MKKNKLQYRQGDIGLAKISKPNNLPDIQKRKILAEGEVTGHLHEVQGDNATLYGDTPQTMILEVREPSELTHDEHSTILIEPGWYKVVRQREYTPEGDMMVAD